MKIKVGGLIFDAADIPIMVILDDGDKEFISNTAKEDTKYAVFPTSMGGKEYRLK